MREKTQVFNKPIGVVRANAGAAQVGESIATVADTMARIAFQDAARKAEKRGIESAKAVDLNALTTINPLTGAPEAAEIPKGFGTIAADSYQRIIDSRFEQSVDTELRLKAKEFGMKYEFNPDAYAEVFSDYIAQMSKNAQGHYKTFIESNGSVLLKDTTLNIKDRAIKRQRAILKQSAIENYESGIGELELVTSIYGADSEEVQALTAKISRGVDDGIGSQFFPKSSKQKSSDAIYLAKAKGQLRRLITPNTSSEDIKLINIAIGTQNPSLLPPGYSAMESVLKGFGNNLSSLTEFEGMATEYLADIQAASIIRENEYQEFLNDKAIREDISLRDDAANAYPYARELSHTIIDDDELSANDVSIKIISEYNKLISDSKFLEQQARLAGGVEGTALLGQSESTKIKAQNLISGLSQGLIDNLVNSEMGLTQEDFGLQMSAIASALKSGEKDLFKLPITIPPKMLSYAQAFNKIISSNIDKDGTIKTAIIERLNSIANAGDLGFSKSKVLTTADIAQIEGLAFGLRAENTYEPFISRLNEVKVEAENNIANGMESTAQELIASNEERIVAYADGLIRKSTLNMTSKDVDKFNLAIQTRNPDMAPTASSKEALTYLNKLASIYPKKGDSTIFTKLKSHLSNYKEGGAKALQARNDELKLRYEMGAAQSLGELSSEIAKLSSETDPNNIIDNYKQVTSKINNIPVLEEDKKNESLQSARAESAKAFFNAFIATNPNELQLTQAATYFNGGSQGVLTSDQATLLSTASKFSKGLTGTDTDISSTLTTLLKSSVTAQQKILEASLAEIEIQQQIEDLGRGLLSPQEGVAVVDELMDRLDIDSYSIVSDPDFLNTDKGQQLVTVIQKGGVLPTTLANVFARISDGGFANMQGLDLGLAMSLYDDIKTHQYEGTTVESRLVTNMPTKQKATLDFLSFATKTFGGDARSIAQSFSVGISLENEEFVNALKVKYGIEEDAKLSSLAQEVDDFFLLSPQDKQALQVMTETFMVRSEQSGVSISKDDILKYGNQWVKDNRPDYDLITKVSKNKSQFYVFDPTSKRSVGALNITVQGNESSFIEYATTRLAESIKGTSLENVGFGPNFKPVAAGVPGQLEVERVNTISLRPAGYAANGAFQYEFVRHTEMGVLDSVPTLTTDEFGDEFVIPQTYITTLDPAYIRIVKRKTDQDLLVAEGKRRALLLQQRERNDIFDKKGQVPYPSGNIFRGLGGN